MVEQMRKEPRGLTGTFVVTKTYYVTVEGNSEEDCYDNAMSLSESEIDEEDFVEMEITLKDGYEYASF
jgi:hypothetical protein